jgi:hypothetical protein
MHSQRKAALGVSPDAAQADAFVRTTYNKSTQGATDLDDEEPDSWRSIGELAARLVARLRRPEPGPSDK